MELTIAHTPDADDAFMYYALTTKKVNTKGYIFKHVIKDIHSLNLDARNGLWDVTAISFAAYPEVSHNYQLLSCGASIGEGYGPIVVSKEPMNPEDLLHAKIAIPGKTTSAYLVLCHFLGERGKPEFVEINFSEVPNAIIEGQVQAGVLIHEAQVTYQQFGLREVVDLGKWWLQKHNLPLPLGANAIRRALPEQVKVGVARIIRSAIEWSLANTPDALSYALNFARGTRRDVTERFIKMYVNQKSIELDQASIEAIRLLLSLRRSPPLTPVDIITPR